MPHLIPAAADPTASVGNVRSLTAVGDSDSFLSLSPILLISNYPLFPLTSLFPLQIFESYVGWWLFMMGNTDKFLLFFPCYVSVLSPPARVCRLTGSLRFAPSPVLVPVQCLIDADPLTQLLSISALLPYHLFWWHCCNQTSRAVSPVRAA